MDGSECLIARLHTTHPHRFTSERLARTALRRLNSGDVSNRSLFFFSVTYILFKTVGTYIVPRAFYI